jgi:hypothetical protein
MANPVYITYCLTRLKLSIDDMNGQSISRGESRKVLKLTVLTWILLSLRFFRVIAKKVALLIFSWATLLKMSLDVILPLPTASKGYQCTLKNDQCAPVLATL